MRATARFRFFASLAGMLFAAFLFPLSPLGSSPEGAAPAANGNLSRQPALPSMGGLRDWSVQYETAASAQGGAGARFRLSQASRSVLGRIDLVPNDKNQEPARLLLHGQEREEVSLPPGRYALRAYFWRLDQAAPAQYPKSLEIDLREGQTAVLELSRDDYSAIKDWLKERKAETNRTRAVRK